MPPAIETISKNAQAAARLLAKSRPEDRRRALERIAVAIGNARAAIVEANAKDLSAAEGRGMTDAMLERLRLDSPRIDAIAAAVADVAGMEDLVGRIERPETRPNGLQIARMRIPLGVVAIIYESRPNVTSDAAALCIKSGNAAILRGGSEARFSNAAIGDAIHIGLESAGMDPRTIQVVRSTDRDAVKQLLAQDRYIDVVIPRGGEGLIEFVAENSRIPVLKHYKGVCSVYVHADADLDMALRIAENAKVQRPSVCNAAETILVDRAVAPAFIPMLCRRFAELGVEVRGDDETCRLGGTSVVAAQESDWGAEYLALIIAVRVVEDFASAIKHIEQFGSNHTETIVTGNQSVAERFLHEVNSSTVMVNASTRFADGGELGLGAEIGISTTKLHAYGPMGAEGLTTTKFIVRGNGQIR